MLCALRHQEFPKQMMEDSTDITLFSYMVVFHSILACDMDLLSIFLTFMGRNLENRKETDIGTNNES
jgi:hypothetical protein